jgi:hypothetical protein
MKLLLSTVYVVSLASLGLGAQARPDFSGTWTMDMSRSEAAAQGAPIGPVSVTIRQTPEEIRIETTRDGSTQLVRYLPAEAKVTGGGGELIGSFRWNGSQLITSFATDISKQAITLQEVRNLNPSGTEMTVDVTLNVEHGYPTGGTGPVKSRNYPNSATGRNVFLKAQ